MARPLFSPRRIAVAIVIALSGLIAGAAAASLTVADDALPQRFTPADPMGGDQAVYHALRMQRNGSGWEAISASYPIVTLHEQGAEQAWNSAGEPVLVRKVWQQKAGFGAHPPGSDARLEWDWQLARTLALDPAGNSTVWIAGEDEQILSARATEAGPVVLGGTVTASQWSRQYVEPGKRILDTCLRAPPPSGPLAGRSFDLPSCTLPGFGFDPAAPPATARELDEVRGPAGYMLLSSALHARGTAASDFGTAVVFDIVTENGGPAFDGMQVWYVESVPVPVQVVTPAGDGLMDVVYLKEWVRGDVPLQGDAALPPLPDPLYGDVTPWGSIDQGIQATLLPSDAWTHAAEPGLDGTPSRLGRWLDAHPDAYTEAFSGDSRTEARYEWTFQVTDGTERIAFTVRLGRPVEQFPFFTPDVDPRLSVEFIDPDPPEVPTRPPDRSVRLASLSDLYETYTGNAANAWSMAWSCAELAWVSCEGGYDYGLGVGEFSQASTQEVDDERPAVVVTDTTTDNNLRMTADGDLDTFASRKFAARDSRGAAAEPAGERPQAFSAASGPMFSDRALVAASTGAAALLGLVYLLWPLLKASPAALFSRIRDDEVLGHPVRRAVHEAVVAEPGIHVQALARRVGYSRATVDHHLRKLLAAGRVRRRTGDGYTCFYPERTDRAVIAAGPALRSASAKQILDAVVARPGASGADLARSIGKSRSTVAHHVVRLRGAGLIEARDDRFYPTAAAVHVAR